MIRLHEFPASANCFKVRMLGVRPALRGGRGRARRSRARAVRSRVPVGRRYTVADCALYAYARVAHEAGYDLATYPAVGTWLARVAAVPGAIDDLEPYPPSALAGAVGARSAYTIRSCAISSNAATKRSQSSKEWVIDSVHSSSRPGVM